MVLPRRNEDDLEDVPAEVRGAIRCLFADSAEEVLRATLGLAPEAGRREATAAPAPSMH